MRSPRRPTRFASPLVLALAFALPACGSSSDEAAAQATPVGAEPGPIEGCDPLVPTYCGFPFPSDAHTGADLTTVTGRRLSFTRAGLPHPAGYEDDPAPFATLDGFSPGASLLAHFPGATVTGLPTHLDPAASLADASPTVVLDADTGERVAHFSELDMSAATDADRAFIVRPVVRMKDAHRYVVAVRHVVDAAGVSIPASPAFAALRDGTPSSEASIEARRGHYEQLFATLAAAGVARADLQLAWDFTTSSTDVQTRWLLHMRDEALALVGAEGPTYQIVQVEENPNPHIRRRIHGLMHVPLYLDKIAARGKLVLGDDGLPRQNGWADFGFVVHIPNSATTGTPGALLQNGHGLLGEMSDGQDGSLATISDESDFVSFGVSLLGLCGGDKVAQIDSDESMLVSALVDGVGTFGGVVGRQHQGILNSLLAMRMMKGRFYKDAAVQFEGKSAIDPAQAYYRGDSQGGIFGTTYMGLTTDVTRGVLGEPGAPYVLLLTRSEDFDQFFGIMRGVYATGMDIQMALGLLQTQWDRTEPTGYMSHVTANPLPGTSEHQVLIHAALGDHQVTTLGAEFIARAVGAKNLAPVNHHVWGLDEVAMPTTGSGLLEFSFNLPEPPLTNIPPTVGGDPHDWIQSVPEANRQAAIFLRTGRIEQTCAGPCVFPPQ